MKFLIKEIKIFETCAQIALPENMAKTVRTPVSAGLALQLVTSKPDVYA